jgi:hypothetical protein
VERLAVLVQSVVIARSVIGLFKIGCSKNDAAIAASPQQVVSRLDYAVLWHFTFQQKMIERRPARFPALNVRLGK